MDSHSKFRLANDPSTETNILSSLALSDHSIIRASIAANPAACQKTLLSLVGDSDSDVIANLKGNSNCFSGNYNVTSCKDIILTLANIDDAEFILSLRKNEQLNNYVSKTSASLKDQQYWLENYKKRESIRTEFYFIIRDLEMKPLGTVRVYDLQGGSFCWGSWIVSPDAPRKTAIESALAVYEFAFYTLGFKQAHFDVRNENKKVIKFHNQMGSKETHKNDLDTFFVYTKEAYENKKGKYTSFFNC